LRFKNVNLEIDSHIVADFCHCTDAASSDAADAVPDERSFVREVIVVVDGPAPDTIAILRTIDDPPLRVIVNPRSLTAAGARNAGMDRANGEWIAFLDGGDERWPEKLGHEESRGFGGLAVCWRCG
jgi:hypothetical protein